MRQSVGWRFWSLAFVVCSGLLSILVWSSQRAAARARELSAAAAGLAAAADPGPLTRPVVGPKLAEQIKPSYRYPHDYVFTRDYFTQNIPVFELALAPYAGKPGVNYLEIGAFEGGSLLWMLDRILTDATSRATVVDAYEGTYLAPAEPRLRGNLQLSGAAARVNLIKGYSGTVMRTLPLATFDIVYIDGSHTAIDVLEDAVLAWRLVKAGGLVIFDDYRYAIHRWRDSPQKPIEFFYDLHRDDAEVVHADYQVILRKLPVRATE